MDCEGERGQAVRAKLNVTSARELDGSIDHSKAIQLQAPDPIYEVTQTKGDGETYPALSPNDEFADYWRWDKGKFGLYGKNPDMLTDVAEQPLAHAYASQTWRM